MCGRQRVTEASLQAAASYAGVERSEIPQQISTRENLGPSAWSAVCIKSKGGRGDTKKVLAAKWGLIAPWDKEVNHFNLFNARSETADELNSFKRLFKGKDARRGIVFMDGFYEWCGEKSKTDGKKQPYYFYREDQPMMAAVLYDYSRELQANTYTMMTRKSFGKMKPMHNREPLLLTEATAPLWLGSDSDVDQLLADESSCTEVLEKLCKYHPVTKKMGLVAYQESDCATPIDAKMKLPVRSHNIASFFGSSPKRSTASSGRGSGICGNEADALPVSLSKTRKEVGGITNFFGSSAACLGSKRGPEEEKEEKEEKEENFKKARQETVGERKEREKETKREVVDLT